MSTKTETVLIPKSGSARDQSNPSELIRELRSLTSLTQAELAQVLGTSLVAVDRWERGDLRPSSQQLDELVSLLDEVRRGKYMRMPKRVLQNGVFASRGASRAALKSLQSLQADLFVGASKVSVSAEPLPPILSRLKCGRFFSRGIDVLSELIEAHATAAQTPNTPMESGASAGKNTYTYDAHTYHTKVPPQGIAEFLRHYLPEGGLVFDPFSGSGMTGVAARIAGADVVLNELSPAACFISHTFTETVSPAHFATGLRTVLSGLETLRQDLYATHCRECGKQTQILYTVWSYRVVCGSCRDEFVLWDHCRKYGRTVREHKILSDFPCPSCKQILRKSTLKRTTAEPILLGYKCCQKKQVEHALTADDIERIRRINAAPPVAEGHYPAQSIPGGVNLNQPKRHGLDKIDRFYTPRNLSALSQIWKAIHKVEDDNIAGMLAFAFTSLYQRVTRLSEYRFWGGSGNTAHFNVPFIFNEANVFVTFERKAASILDHLETTASQYQGRKVVVCNSATHLDYLPDDSVDLIFTDPPFGANINYSEMNFLWEAWLGEFTDPTEEAIVNRYQSKSVDEYEELMVKSLSECYRVLRASHWMLLVFMNSSGRVWKALRSAVERAGFVIVKVDIFDKQHGTFKQFVSENAVGCDLVMHCRKSVATSPLVEKVRRFTVDDHVRAFLVGRSGSVPRLVYMHVNRQSEPDYRLLYSEWVASSILEGHEVVDFATFRDIASVVVGEHKSGSNR